LAVAAHGVASGHTPDTTGLLLLMLLGVAAGAMSRHLSTATGFLALLTGTQVAAHVALSATAAPMTMSHQSSTSTMLITHLIAIPLCALLISGAGRLYEVITSVLRALRVLISAPVTDRNSSGAQHTPAPEPLITLIALGGTGVRGPPAI
jgi:hypothetical protein